jgi:hypothetical protein
MDVRRRVGNGLLDVVAESASFTLGPDNNEQVIQATAGLTITLPNDLPQGFSCLIEQGGSGAVVLAAAANASLVNRQSFDRTAGQYAVCSLYVRSNVDGRSAVYLLGGDGATA